MKAMAPFTLIIFWVIGLAMIFAMGKVGLNIGGGAAMDLPIKIEAYSIQHALDMSKTYMDTALQFSNYQACYDLMKKGGNSQLTNSNKISYNGIEYGIISDKQAFTDELKDQILGNINGYANLDYSFTEKYIVKVPSYKSLDMTTDGTASAATDGKMILEMDVEGATPGEGLEENYKGKIIVKKTASLGALLHLDCLAIYDRMKAKSDDLGSKIGELLKAGIDKMTAGITSSSCDNIAKDEEQIVSDGIKALESGDVLVDVVSINLNMDLITGVTKDENGNFLCRFEKADINLKSSAIAKVEMTNTENVPVDNGQEIAYEPIKSIFAVTAEY